MLSADGIKKEVIVLLFSAEVRLRNGRSGRDDGEGDILGFASRLQVFSYCTIFISFRFRAF